MEFGILAVRREFRTSFSAVLLRFLRNPQWLRGAGLAAGIDFERPDLR